MNPFVFNKSKSDMKKLFMPCYYFIFTRNDENRQCIEKVAS